MCPQSWLLKAQEGPEGEGVNGHFKISHREVSEHTTAADKYLTEVLKRNKYDRDERKHGISKSTEGKLRRKTLQKACNNNNEG